MKEFIKFLREPFEFSDHISVSIMDVLILTAVLIVASLLLTLVRKLLSRKMPREDKKKFKVVFGYARWLIYVLIFFITLDGLGVNVTGIFAASAALLIGIGLALQTFFKILFQGFSYWSTKQYMLGTS